MKPEPYETIPHLPTPPTEQERLALIESDLTNARYHLAFLDGDWGDVSCLLAGIIDAQAALRKLMR